MGTKIGQMFDFTRRQGQMLELERTVDGHTGQNLDKSKARTYKSHIWDRQRTFFGHGHKVDKLWGTYIDQEHPEPL